jgi:GMP synthase-like glutamine amidotransferase
MMRDTRVLGLKNARNEEMEYMENLLREKSVHYEYIQAKNLDSDEVGKILSDFSHIVILGGPQGVYETDKHPYLNLEMELIRKAVSENKPLLGICLGAQLIAGAFNARVYPFVKEIGWYEIEKVSDDDILKLPEKLIVFQWHGDTFDLPKGAKLLYKGSKVNNQAFRLGSALGLQFHIEVKKETVRNWIKNEKTLSKEKKEKIIDETDKYIKDLNRWTELVVDNFLRLPNY